MGRLGRLNNALLTDRSGLDALKEFASESGSPLVLQDRFGQISLCDHNGYGGELEPGVDISQSPRGLLYATTRVGGLPLCVSLSSSERIRVN